MLVLPLGVKIIPLILAGMIAVTPMCNLSKIQKDSNTNTNEQNKDKEITVNDKTNEKVTKIVTVREGFKGVLVDGNIFEVPFFQKTTVEKTYTETDKEEGKKESNNINAQNTNSSSTEIESGTKMTIISRAIDGGKQMVTKIWQRIRP